MYNVGMTGKFHFRRQNDGRYYVQGVIPEKLWHSLMDMVDGEEPLKRLNDFVAVAELTVDRETLVDKTEEFSGDSNLQIIARGF